MKSNTAPADDTQFWLDVTAGKAPDPVHYVPVTERLESSEQDDIPGWYFWTETWADRMGPYPTVEAARQALDAYCKFTLGT